MRIHTVSQGSAEQNRIPLSELIASDAAIQEEIALIKEEIATLDPENDSVRIQRLRDKITELEDSILDEKNNSTNRDEEEATREARQRLSPFRLRTDPKVHILPIISSMSKFKMRAHEGILPYGAEAPSNVVSIEVERRGYERYPIELWGYVRYTREEFDEDSQIDPDKRTALHFRKQDGVLTINDVPQQRVTSVSITRGLDGTSGNISWDRYDETLMTGLLPRPVQRAGGLTIAINGGADTNPGTIFTGIAIGNAQKNTASESLIEMELFGREIKLKGDGGLYLINVPYFDGHEDTSVMKFLCNYGGVPFKNMTLESYRLPSSQVLSAQPLVDFATGTPVWDAIEKVQQLAGTLAFFNRFGELEYIEVARSRPVNWVYPDTAFISYNDKPDFSTLRNSLVMSGLVVKKSFGESDSNTVSTSDAPRSDPYAIENTGPCLAAVRLDTTPYFAWDRMMHYAFSGIFRSQAEFNRAIVKIAEGAVRPRAGAQCVVPGNAQVEVLDRVNSDWVVTSIGHTWSVESKEWTTSLSLELMFPIVPEGDVTFMGPQDLN